MKNNLLKISESNSDHIESSIEQFWLLVRQRLNVVVTLNEITPKSIPRSGIAMSKAIYQLLEALNDYDNVKRIK